MKLVTYTVTIAAPTDWKDNQLDAACDALTGLGRYHDEVSPASALTKVIKAYLANYDALAGCKVIVSDDE